MSVPSQARPAGVQSVLMRSEELGALDAILSFDRRGQLAELLTDDDIATLKHLANAGMGDNTMRALTSDLAYLEAWCSVAMGAPLPWPAPESLLLKFVAHHLWNPAERESNSEHGMPEEIASVLRVKGLLRSTGPHAPATVRRRLTSWSILTRWRGLTGSFSAPLLKSALRLAVGGSGRARPRKSKRAITGDILSKLLTACAGDRVIDVRDRALLLLAFASGGRRRSEVANLRVEDLVDEDRTDPTDENAPPLPCLTIRLGRTNTTSSDDTEHVVLIGRPVIALKLWLTAAGIETGPVFRRIDRWSNIDARALSPQSVNLIVKARCEQAGLNPTLYSAQGLRSGYLTEAANRGIPLPEAMHQSLHKSVTQAAGYYKSADRKTGPVALPMV